MLRLPFTSDEAKKLNQEILKHYTLLLTASMEMAKEAHSTFEGSHLRRISTQSLEY
jgi:ribonucleoside-diphosphate reductase alpha chain